jgi:Tol biopolymer transport system component/tRNA A-37 threonylcarbamoyl transferase component Bud32
MSADSSELERLARALADRYVLERELGRGGMATVYLARDLRHERRVAIKVLHPELSAVLGAERFLAEIKLTAALQHPHILPLFDSGSADGLLFYVMPFVEGETLRDRLLRETQLPIDDAVRIAREVASAVDYAHRHGVIHRDIKPENILLHDGSAVVADFGIALAVQQAGGQRMTQTGLSLGTPQYMAPEQAMGEREITPRADVYALGAVTYEMLAGEPPFSGPSAQAIVARVMTEEPRPLSAQRRTVPPHVDVAVRRALEKLPADRFGSAADFAAALDARGATTTIAASAPRPRSRVGPRALAAVVLSALALGALGARQLARPGDSTVRYTQKTFGDEVVSRARWAPDGKTLVFSAALYGQLPELYVVRPDYPEPQPLGVGPAQLLAVSSQGELAVLVRSASINFKVYRGTLARMPVGGGAPRELVDSVRDADWAPDGSGLAIVRTVAGNDRLEFPEGKVLVQTAGWISDPRFSPDGRSIAYIEHPFKWDDRGTINLVDLEGHPRTLRPDEYAKINGVVWSRSGDEVFFSAVAPNVHQELVFRVTLSGRLRQALNGAGNLSIEDVNAEGRWLVSRDAFSTRLLLRTARDTVPRNVGWLDNSFGPVVSGDGRLVAFGEASTESGVNYSVFMRPTEGGKAVRLGEGFPTGFSRDGRWLLARVPSRPARLTLYATGAGAERVVSTNGLEVIESAGWGPDDASVWFCGARGTAPHACWLSSLSGGAPRPLPGETRGISPDGRFVLASAQGRFVLTSFDGESPHSVPGLAVDDHVLRWGHDGHVLWVYERRSHAVDALNVATGSRTTLVPDLTAVTGPVFAGAAFADDPRTLLYARSRSASELFEVTGAR